MLKKDKATPTEAKPKRGKTKASNEVRPAPATRTARKAGGARKKEDLQQRIERRAYELWESEGRPEGREHAHWQQAQREIASAQRAG